MPPSSINRWLDRRSPASPDASRNARKQRPLLALIVCLAILVHFVPSIGAAAESRVLPQLQREAAAKPDSIFRVIVTRLGQDQRADEAITALGGTKAKEISGGSFVALMPGRSIAQLGGHAAVKYVAPDSVMHKAAAVDASRLGTIYPQVVQAAQLWSGRGAITGAGVGVAVIDTGINPALKDWNDASGKSRLIASVKFNSTTSSMADAHGHGTHVAGIIGGNSWHVSDSALRGKYVGIAPEANLINVKVADDNGMSYLSDVVNAIEWVISNRQTYNIRVINLSLISSVAESYRSSILSAAVERAWFNGIFVVVAAGNAGPDTLYYPPANDPFVVTVGASDPRDTADSSNDLLAPWSSYGTSQDGISKPDVVAPGRYIRSTLASNSATLARNYPQRVVDGSYIWMSGTSMAAPMVAGLAALAFQAHPEWTNDQVKWLLQNTAIRIGGAAPVAGQGYGLVDAAAVVRYPAAPGLANQGIKINEHLIGPDGATNYTAAPGASWSTASWSTASWSTASWSTANSSTASWGTSTEQGIE
jgi:serine protease AprX